MRSEYFHKFSIWLERILVIAIVLCIHQSEEEEKRGLVLL